MKYGVGGDRIYDTILRIMYICQELSIKSLIFIQKCCLLRLSAVHSYLLGILESPPFFKQIERKPLRVPNKPEIHIAKYI